jgi:hypothetical protein
MPFRRGLGQDTGQKVIGRRRKGEHQFSMFVNCVFVYLNVPTFNLSQPFLSSNLYLKSHNIVWKCFTYTLSYLKHSFRLLCHGHIQPITVTVLRTSLHTQTQEFLVHILTYNCLDLDILGIILEIHSFIFLCFQILCLHDGCNLFKILTISITQLPFLSYLKWVLVQCLKSNCNHVFWHVCVHIIHIWLDAT